MDTKAKLIRGVFAGLLISNTIAAWAQTANPATAQAPAKPPLTSQTAVTPVEQIRLGDRNVTLNIRTLAEVKRLQEEKDLKEKLQKALQGAGAVNIPASRAPVSVPVATPSSPRTAPGPVASNAAKPKAAPTLVGVFGPPDAMKAEIQTGPRSTLTIKAGDVLGNFKVEAVNQSGLTLLASNGKRQSLAVGQQAPL